MCPNRSIDGTDVVKLSGNWPSETRNGDPNRAGSYDETVVKKKRNRSATRARLAQILAILNRTQPRDGTKSSEMKEKCA